MLTFLIFCILFQSVLLSTVHHNHDRNLQNGVSKNRLEGVKSVDTSLHVEEEPQFNNNVNEITAIYNVRHPSEAMAKFKQFQPKNLAPNHNKILKNSFIEGTQDRDYLPTLFKELNKKLTLISRNEYQSHNVRFEIEPKSRRKRNVNNSSVNDTITLNSSVKTKNNSRYNESSNELTLNQQPTLSDVNSNLNNDSEPNRRRIYFSSILLVNEKEELRTKIENLARGIKNKVLPLTKVKIALGDDNGYRIGYVIANIDTLYNQIGKLRAEMNYQDENSMKELLEKMKTADNVISNLLQMLSSYSSYVNI